MPYDERFVTPMREELTRLGVTGMRTVEEVDAALKDARGTTLVVVNSVCGCSARNASPAVSGALRHAKRPDNSLPSSPDRISKQRRGRGATSRATSHHRRRLRYFRDGRLVYMLERSQIEGRNAAAIANDLVAAFDEHC